MNDEAAPRQSDTSDNVWGAKAIGIVLDGRTESQVYYLYRSGALKGAVRKLGHRTMVGSRRRLRELVLSPEA